MDHVFDPMVTTKSCALGNIWQVGSIRNSTLVVAKSQTKLKRLRLKDTMRYQAEKICKTVGPTAAHVAMA